MSIRVTPKVCLKCLTAKLKIGITFRTFIAQILVEYCQKGIRKEILTYLNKLSRF